MIYIGASRFFSVLVQFLFVLFFARSYPLEVMGQYALSLSIAIPVLTFIFFDLNGKILSSRVDTSNLGFFIFIPIVILLAVLFVLSFDFIDGFNLSLVFPFVFILKFSEMISEASYTYLRRDLYFKNYFLKTFKRYSIVYIPAIFAIYSGLSHTYALVILSLLSLMIMYNDCKDLISKYGWEFYVQQFKFAGYIKNNFTLGSSSIVRSLQTHSLRYYISFYYGLEMLGMAVPVFYALTAFANFATIVDNYLTPKIIKKISISKINIVYKRYKNQAIFLFMSLIFIILGSYFLSDFYFKLFFPNNSGAYPYSGSILILSFGVFFYIFKGILRVVSYKFGLIHRQLQIQLSTIVVLFALIYPLNSIFGVNGIFIAFVLSVIYNVYITFFIINVHIKND